MKKITLFILLSFFCFNAALAQTLKATATQAILMGMVTNFQAKPLKNEIIMFVDDKTGKVVKVNTDGQGRFEVLVPTNATYSLKYKTFTTDVDYTKMQVPADKFATYEVLIKIDPPKEFILDNVYFDSGKSTLKPNSHKALDDLVEVLKIKKNMVVEIQGHTDDVGDAEANMKLSQARADEVKKYLVAHGVNEKNVTSKGYGATMPVAYNDTEAGKAKNRRTNLKVIKDE